MAEEESLLEAYHSLYCSFHLATQPSGTFGGGGPGGASKSAIVVDLRLCVFSFEWPRFEYEKTRILQIDEEGRGCVLVGR